jgi:hypothetical protein
LNAIVTGSFARPFGLPDCPFTHGIAFHLNKAAQTCAVAKLWHICKNLVTPVEGEDPSFVNGPIGDFRLRPDSLARGKGCTVIRGTDGSLTCVSSDAAIKPDIGAYQDKVLVEGPDYLYRGDERPRVMKAMWLTNMGSVLLEIAFSSVMQIPSNDTRIAIRLVGGETVYSEPCQRARGIALDCRFSMLRAPPGATATLLVPRSLTSATGLPVTLWAAGTPLVEFQR